MSNAMERLKSRQAGNHSPSYNALDVFAASALVNSGKDIVMLPMSKLHDFSGHTFKRRPEHDPYILSLKESIKENGILNPLIVRPHPALVGDYEIVAGHTRKQLGASIGFTEFPCTIKHLDNDDAIIQMSETNVQRPDWLPSEKAMTYKAHLEATKRKYQHKLGRPKAQEGKTRELGSHISPEDSKRIRDLAAQRWGISGRAFDTYIKLNDLIPGLLNMVDGERLPLKAGYQLSFLPLTSQQQLLSLLLEFPQCSINESKARDIRTFVNESDVWPRILGIDGEPEKRVAVWKVNLPRETLSNNAKKYLDEPELQSLVAETVNRYVAKREASN